MPSVYYRCLVEYGKTNPECSPLVSKMSDFVNREPKLKVRFKNKIGAGKSSKASSIQLVGGTEQTSGWSQLSAEGLVIFHG